MALLKLRRYSRPRLLALALVIATLGGYLVSNSSAAPSVLASVEAEGMALPAGATVINDVAASGGQAVRFTKPGVATRTVSLARTSTSTSVVARSARCNSRYQTLQVKVDGTTRLSIALNSTSWKTYSATFSLAPGSHNVSLEGRDFSASCRRDLFVDVLRFQEEAAARAPTVALSASPTSVAAGSASTLTWSSTSATGCTAGGAWSGSQPTSGSQSTGPLSQTSTYNLTCTGEGGTASASATVTVTPASPPPSSGASLHPFGSVVVAPEFNMNGAGSNVDSIAFWEAPDPAQSLMFVTSKSIALVEVWRYPYRSSGDQLAALKNPCFGAGTNGVVVDQRTDLLYVSPRNTLVCVFQLPSLTFVKSFDTRSSGGTTEPNLALLRTPAGEDRLYVSYDMPVQVHDATSGTELGRFTPQKGLETMVGDPYYQTLYIPDENGRTGVYEHRADGAFTGTVFGGGVFGADAEGVALFECAAGEGLIVVSDQLATLNDYEVFDRRTKRHLGVLQLQGVAYTDGIASTQQPSTAFPAGAFAAIHNDTSVAGVGWGKVFDAISQKTGARFGCP